MSGARRQLPAGQAGQGSLFLEELQGMKSVEMASEMRAYEGRGGM